MNNMLKRGAALLIGISLTATLFACGQKKEPKLKNLDDLKTVTLGAQLGTVGQSLAEDAVGKDKKESQVKTFEKYANAIQALEQGKVRAVIMDEAPAKRFLAKDKKLTIMKEPLSGESYAIAFKKGNTALCDQVNKILDTMKKDGSLQAIIEKYNSDQDAKASDIDYNKNAKNGDLAVGTEAGFAPYELKVADGYIGIDIEMCAKIAKALDKTLVIKNMDFASLIPAVNAGKADMICAGITVNDERKKNVDFSENYVDGAKQVAVVMADDYAG